VSVLGEPTFAWEPLTPRGVAAFARASFERLFVVHALFALLAAAVLGWILSQEIYPTIATAIDQLPATGDIRAGRLNWNGDSPVLLAEGNVLALSVDLEHGGSIRSPADFQFEFGRNSVRVFSLFGETELAYPPDYWFAANHTDAHPAWGAWSPVVLVSVIIGTFISLLLTWMVLATLYCVPVWVICFFSNRDLGLGASWRLAGAALMPGAMLISVALLLYVMRAFDLIQLLYAFGMHFIIGWIYLFVSPMFLNRVLPGEKKNPFQAAQTA